MTSAHRLVVSLVICAGSRAVIQGLFGAFDSIDGSLRRQGSAATIRPAERGEFTRRAFENGKMDLTEGDPYFNSYLSYLTRT